MPRTSHPLVHPDPAPPAPPPAAAPAPAQQQGQGPAPAPAALQVQGPAPAPAGLPAQAQGQGNAGPNAPPGVLMRNFPGAPGTRSGLGLRLAQAFLAATAIAVLASADYTSITTFRYLVLAAALQCTWSLAMGILDVYAILVGRSFRTARVVGILSVGDWITGAMTISSVRIGGRHLPYQQRSGDLPRKPLPELHVRDRHGLPELVHHGAVLRPEPRPAGLQATEALVVCTTRINGWMLVA